MKIKLFFLCVTLFGILGCKSFFETPPQYGAYKNWRTTQLGLHVAFDAESEGFANDSYLNSIDDHFRWAVSKGLDADSKLVYVVVRHGTSFQEGTKTVTGFPVFNPAFASDNERSLGYCTGLLLGVRPITVAILDTAPHVLRHELIHVLLYRTVGDVDRQHANPIWKLLGL